MVNEFISCFLLAYFALISSVMALSLDLPKSLGQTLTVSRIFVRKNMSAKRRGAAPQEELTGEFGCSLLRILLKVKREEGH